ncbi:hypothetical protein BPNPMPFG_006308 [Mesorhizobium sp. AR07]|uniref:hypothetical protein n=1 Tax=Mesorhizobium sp. AR07 TaxID=2865838 RepID=UPI00215FD547|nr:hypothetical protein [Mesorhizobium sp. AR07]UVK44393.1 hypothetical protein BPNPMPFG_006308 [Mesorhizobium sp. AR07]
MDTNILNDRIIALMGRYLPDDEGSAKFAARVIEYAIKEEEDSPGIYDYYDADTAIEAFLEACTDGFQQNFRWVLAANAVGEALQTLADLASAPQGYVVVNGNSGAVFAQGTTVKAAQAEIESIGGHSMAWNEVRGARGVSGGAGNTVYHLYQIGLMDWEASDGARVAALGYHVCDYVARDILNDLDAA